MASINSNSKEATASSPPGQGSTSGGTAGSSMDPAAAVAAQASIAEDGRRNSLSFQTPPAEVGSVLSGSGRSPQGSQPQRRRSSNDEAPLFSLVTPIAAALNLSPTTVSPGRTIPTMGFETTAGASASATSGVRRQKKKPPPLMQSTSSPQMPTTNVLVSHAFHSNTAASTPNQMLPSFAGSSSTAPSVGVPRVNLSPDSLVVAHFMVNHTGCVSNPNPLLMNASFTSEGHRFIQPTTPFPDKTPPLRSTNRAEPVSPLVYSIDELRANSDRLSPASAGGGTFSNLLGTSPDSTWRSDFMLPPSVATPPPPAQPPVSLSQQLSGGSETTGSGVLSPPSASSSLPQQPCHVGNINSLSKQGQQPGSTTSRMSDHFDYRTRSLSDASPHGSAIGWMSPSQTSRSAIYGVDGARTQLQFQDLIIKERIGKGACGHVYRAVHTNTGKSFAVKQIDLSPIEQHHGVIYERLPEKLKQMHQIVYRELQILHCHYRSPHLLKTYDAFYNGNAMTLSIVMEYMDFGTLEDLGRQFWRQHQREGHVAIKSGSNTTCSNASCVHTTSPFSPPADLGLTSKPSNIGLFPPQRGVRSESTATLEWIGSGSSGSSSQNPLNNSPPIGCSASPGETVSPQHHYRAPPPARLSPQQLSCLALGVGGNSSVDAVEGRSRSGGSGAEKSPSQTSKRDPSNPSNSTNSRGGSTTTPAPQNAMPPHAVLTAPSLSPTIHRRLPIPERAVCVIAEQVLLALKEMHEHRHVHRDIKPQNILVNKQGGVRLSDFGLAEISTPDGDPASATGGEMDARCSGTNRYMSPERQRGEPHGPPCDVWAVGVTLAECAIGRYPYPIGDCQGPFEVMAIMSKPIEFTADEKEMLTKTFMDFIALATDSDATKRPSASTLLAHEVFSQWPGSYNLGEELEEALPNFGPLDNLSFSSAVSSVVACPPSTSGAISSPTAFLPPTAISSTTSTIATSANASHASPNTRGPLTLQEQMLQDGASEEQQKELARHRRRSTPNSAVAPSFNLDVRSRSRR